MAQDFEGFPRQWYNEGFMSEDDFEEAYCGESDSEEDFARHIISEYYNLESEMGDLARYFDYEAFGRELFMHDYSMGANNRVFRVICPLSTLSPIRAFPKGRLFCRILR